MNEPKGLNFGDDNSHQSRNSSQNSQSSSQQNNQNSQREQSSRHSTAAEPEGSSNNNNNFQSPIPFKLPKLLPTKIHAEKFGGVTYQLEGELVPVLTVDVSRSSGVFFEHHILLWKHSSIRVRMKSLRGAFKRFFAGLQIFMIEAVGEGCIAFSRDGAGHIVPIHLKKGYAIDVREHQFLAATNNIDYDFERVRGLGNMFFGGSGFFIDKFRANSEDGIVWIHGYGNVFEKVLAPGESIDLETGAWLYKSPSVTMETRLDNLSSGFLGGTKLILNRFTGPGTVGIQSMCIHNPDGSDDGGNNPTNNGGNTSILGAAINNMINN